MNKIFFIFPNINPIIFSLGPINFYWYGLMYFLGFIFALHFSIKRKNKLQNIKKEEIKDLLYFIFIGIFIGGRLGYILFYNIKLFFNHPISIIKVWEGGMSFHGGLLGATIIIFIFCKIKKINFFQITDFIVPLVPFGIGLGRIGNFINCELWGRVCTNYSYAMIFPNSYISDIIAIKNNHELISIYKMYKALPRHPSQIYECILEGFLLFVILNIFTLKKRSIGSTTGLFMILYGVFRFFIEFFRQPDIQIGLFYDIISMGQLLSIPMIIIGLIFIKKSYYIYLKKNETIFKINKKNII